jgi:hypothetical protein
MQSAARGCCARSRVSASRLLQTLHWPSHVLFATAAGFEADIQLIDIEGFFQLIGMA